MIDIYQFKCLNDNYGFLLKDIETNEVISIDSPDAEEIIKNANEHGFKISAVWNTHWHKDHAGGNQQIYDEMGAKCVGPHEVASHGFLLHQTVKAGDEISFGKHKAKIIDLSGHTLGQIGYWFYEEKLLFVGDALFVLGCGRLFEGDAKMAYTNLSALFDLDDETKIYCAHEYSKANAIFCESLNLSNPKLKERIEEINNLSEHNIPTVPTYLGIEKNTNPFLLADKENLIKELGLEGKEDFEVFAHIRKLKDNF